MHMDAIFQLIYLGRFLHRSPLPLCMLNLLAKRHNATLRELRFYELEMFWKLGISYPNQLQMLECRSVSEGKALGKIVQANARTLETLRLGKEKELVEQYQRSRIEITQSLNIFTTVMKLQNLPRLREIALYGLDVSSLIPQSIP